MSSSLSAFVLVSSPGDVSCRAVVWCGGSRPRFAGDLALRVLHATRSWTSGLDRVDFQRSLLGSVRLGSGSTSVGTAPTKWWYMGEIHGNPFFCSCTYCSTKRVRSFSPGRGGGGRGHGGYVPDPRGLAQGFRLDWPTARSAHGSFTVESRALSVFRHVCPSVRPVLDVRSID